MFLRAPSARKRLTALLAVTALSGGLGMAAAFDQMPNLSGESRHAGDRLMDASGGSCRGEGPTLIEATPNGSNSVFERIRDRRAA